jgi:nucleotide-binding universal stress UspA family protein
MTTRSDTAVRSGSTGRERSSKGVSETRILAAVDGSEGSARMLEYLRNLNERGAPLEVIALNVQPTPEDWRLRGYETFKRDEVIDRLVADRGKPIVEGFARQLERTGIGHTERVEIGDAAETIARCAVEEGCGLILISESRAGAARRWLAKNFGLTAGSISAQVVQLADVPVVIVK